MVELELNVIDAPVTADNFAVLARRGFYDGLTFHRVVPYCIVQGGDPRHDTEGGPGYNTARRVKSSSVSSRNGWDGA